MNEKEQTQRDMILAHLKSGRRITPKEAWEQYGCYRLSSIIYRLRKAGYDIETQIRHEGDNNFASYGIL